MSLQDGKILVSGSSSSDDSSDKINQNLHTMPQDVMDQLTNLLWMDPRVCITNPDKKWLEVQESQVKLLDGSLLRPYNVLTRLTTHINNRCRPAKMVHLCHPHRCLNPRVIRCVMLLVASELTRRTDRFRTWRSRTILQDSLAAWLDRIDAATALWIGPKAFQAVFGYDQPSSTVQAVKSACEACILSVVGGRPQLLSDLRASMISRQDRYPKGSRVQPRLWCLVESWIAQFDGEVRKAILEASDVLAEEIIVLNTEISKDKRNLKVLLVQSGKTSPKERVRGKKKHRKLPKPCAPSQALEFPNHWGHVPIKEKSTALNLDGGGEAATFPETGINEYEVDATGGETWGWLNQRIREQGLTPLQSREVLRDVHPALSEHSSKNTARAQSDANRAPSRSSWTTITVHTEEGEDQGFLNPKKIRPMSLIPESELAELCQNSEMDVEIYSTMQNGEEDETGQYTSARQSWKKNDQSHTRLVCLPPPSMGVQFPSPMEQQPLPSSTYSPPTCPPRPASSVYSSNAGFRRTPSEKKLDALKAILQIAEDRRDMEDAAAAAQAKPKIEGGESHGRN